MTWMTVREKPDVVSRYQAVNKNTILVMEKVPIEVYIMVLTLWCHFYLYGYAKLIKDNEHKIKKI